MTKDTHITIPMARLIELETAEHERDILRRWKSTHAPRMDALEGLLHAAQAEAESGREAVATLDSERLANARLTAELEDAQRQRELVFAELLKEQAENARARHALRELMEALDTGSSLSIAEAMTAADAVLAPNVGVEPQTTAEKT